MKFRIEQILNIEGKVYLIAESLDPNVNFKLSDSCFLGSLPIENWFDIPKAANESGSQRNDLFSFVLKKEVDKAKVKEKEIMDLVDRLVRVIDPIYTISGTILAILECNTGRLEVNTILVSNNDIKKWRVVNNSVVVGGKDNMALLKKAEEKFWFFNELEPIGHSTAPPKDDILLVILNGS